MVVHCGNWPGTRPSHREQHPQHMRQFHKQQHPHSAKVARTRTETSVHARNQEVPSRVESPNCCRGGYEEYGVIIKSTFSLGCESENAGKGVDLEFVETAIPGQ